MDGPSELSLHEIRKFMLENGCKVTNHALVKHFKQFLTNPDTQNEARKQFKTYVNILATIKNDDNQKYLLLRKKYLHECPSEDIVNRTEIPMSPGSASISSDGFGSPFRQPPPYKPPPEVSPSVVKVPFVQSETRENYRDCVNEFAAAVRKIDPHRLDHEPNSPSIDDNSNPSPSLPPRNRQNSIQFNFSRENSTDDDKENIVSASVVNKSNVSIASDKKIDQIPFDDANMINQVENQMSVKEATRKFNRMASEEEAKIISPPSKKKPEKDLIEEKLTPDVTLAHPKAKEWIVSAAKANYQELAKLALEYPELVRLQDPTTGYTSLHWAAKHGNVDVVKLIAGTHKADVNARTNGGYTPLHIATQFGKDEIFQILCNVYKADRDLMDWSGNKPLDYSKQRTSVSASTYSKIKARRKHSEKDLGFLRIGSLNVRVKKTTEAFSNFLGVGGGNTTNSATLPEPLHRQHHHHHHHQYQHHPHAGTMRNPKMRTTTDGVTVQMRSNRTSVPLTNNNQYDKIHKTWGSVDNIPHNDISEHMPPPKGDTIKKRKTKRNTSDYNTASGYSSMPTTPNQLRAPIVNLSEHPNPIFDSDSDSACGFGGSNWSVSCSQNGNNGSGSSDRNRPSYV